MRAFALRLGKWRVEDGEGGAALGKRSLGGDRRVQVDEEDGKPSKSLFSPKNRYRDATFCEVQIFTGRTHQIRVHALALGHPVAGDTKYGERDDNKPLRELGLKRMFLHSHFLKFNAEGEFGKLIVNAPLPDELREMLEKLQIGRASCRERVRQNV